MALIKLTLKAQTRAAPKASHETHHKAKVGPSGLSKAGEAAGPQPLYPPKEADEPAKEVYLSIDAIVSLEDLDAGGSRVTVIGGGTYDAAESVSDLAALVGVAKRQRG